LIGGFIAGFVFAPFFYFGGLRGRLGFGFGSRRCFFGLFFLWGSIFLVLFLRGASYAGFLLLDGFGSLHIQC